MLRNTIFLLSRTSFHIHLICLAVICVCVCARTRMYVFANFVILGAGATAVTRPHLYIYIYTGYIIIRLQVYNIYYNYDNLICLEMCSGCVFGLYSKMLRFVR